MAAAASVTLALLHFRVWLGWRGEWASLLFAVAATATAVVALFELAIARSHTTAEYATLVRWALAPLWFLTVALIGFVRVFFGTGRRWLALGSIVLWTLTVIVNFLPGQNLVFKSVASLRPVEFGGGSFVVGEGVANPWNAVNYLGTLLMLAFVVDASIALWRKGGRRRAAVVGGGVVFFFLVAGVHSALIEAGLIRSPYMISFSFLGVVIAMSSELSRDVMRAARTSWQLQQSEAALRENAESMNLAARAAQLALWRWDVAQDVIWVNDDGRYLYSVPVGENITFSRFLETLHPDDRTLTQQAVNRCLEGGGEYRAEYRVVLPDGKIRWIAAQGQCVRGDDGGTKLIGVSMDISAGKKAELEAVQQRTELAHLARVTTLSELAGSLAHELNQPLTAILSNAQAAQRFMNADPVDMDEVRDILRDIAAEDERASEIISRMRAMMKKGEAEMKPRDLNTKIREVLMLIHSDLVARNISLSLQLSPRLPLVNGDRVQLAQVLMNLILNGCDAMSASPPGERRLLIQTESEGDDRVRVSVVDHGVGLAPELLELVFEPFYSTKAHGLGMGLAICKSIITAHGGRIWAANNPDRGAAFHFTLKVVGKDAA